MTVKCPVTELSSGKQPDIEVHNDIGYIVHILKLIKILINKYFSFYIYMYIIRFSIR